jgi:preprotein translocase subunit SecA
MGRAARQGNPGSAQVFVSAEDPLIATYAPALAKKIIVHSTKGECHIDFSAEVAKIQAQVERTQFELRKQIVNSDAWFDSIRESLH